MPNETQNKPKPTISFSNLPSIIFVVIFIVGIGAVLGLLGYLAFGIKENITPVAQKPSVKVADEYFGNDFIQVKSPQKNATVKNPVLIFGKANVDEANVRVKITDDDKNILADTFITADGWMDKLYPFEKEINYKTPQTENGLIEVFEESARDGSEIYKIEVLVVFEDYEDTFSDWKVYRSEEFEFEMKYPEEWIEKNIEDVYFDVCFRKDISFDHPKRFTEINIQMNKNNKSLSFEEIISNLENTGRVYEQKEYIIINNEKVFKAGITNWGMVSGKQFLIVREKYWYDVVVSGTNVEDVEIDQILSSFKFIEKEENTTKCISKDCVIENCISAKGIECISEEGDYTPIIESKSKELQTKYPNFNCNWGCNKMHGNDCRIFCIKRSN